MNLSIAHLGPPGTYAEQVTLFYADWLKQNTEVAATATLCPYPSIAQTLKAVAKGEVSLGIVPVENLIEGGVTMTLDTIWGLENLKIHLALVMPIVHTLISCAENLGKIQIVYSHPQALAQCQGWLEQFLPKVQLISTNSTTEALSSLSQDSTAAAISGARAAQINDLPIIANGINDYSENCTRFWVVSANTPPELCLPKKTKNSHTSLAFSLPANLPGALVKALEIFANLEINLSRIESRPTKRSLGEYLFFIDLEADANLPQMQSALLELASYTEVLRILGSYNVLYTDSLGD
ncbi:MAG: prephenate dehydratase [Calothrix sp. SM1_7_51]|nr:prephenate dehydratase [Calothrix sp. SM1_7_51]